jgi:acetoin utilization protein AcuB
MIMTVAQWMKHPVVTAKPLDSLLHAREIMGEHRINQLPVMVDGHVVGIVTDRDLRDAFPSVFESVPEPTHRWRARKADPGADPAAIPVEDVMTQNVLTLSPQASVVEAVHVLRRERIGAIPIVDGGRMVGILTRSDLLDALATLAGRA